MLRKPCTVSYCTKLPASNSKEINQKTYLINYVVTMAVEIRFIMERFSIECHKTKT